MKHEHDGWLYYLPNGDLTFQTMDHYRRNGNLEPGALKCRRIYNDTGYLTALEENVTNTTPTQRDTLGKENAT